MICSPTAWVSAANRVSWVSATKGNPRSSQATVSAAGSSVQRRPCSITSPAHWASARLAAGFSTPSSNRTVIRGRYGNASTIGVWVDGTYEVAAQLSEELATNPASPPPVICAPPLLDQVYLDEPDAGSPTP